MRDTLAIIHVLISLAALVGGGWWCLFARRVMLKSVQQGELLTAEIRATRDALTSAKNKEILKKL
jgi:hypothetical protein